MGARLGGGGQSLAGHDLPKSTGGPGRHAAQGSVLHLPDQHLPHELQGQVLRRRAPKHTPSEIEAVGPVAVSCLSDRPVQPSGMVDRLLNRARGRVGSGVLDRVRHLSSPLCGHRLIQRLALNGARSAGRIRVLSVPLQSARKSSLVRE